jgi:hypothetical protein
MINLLASHNIGRSTSGCADQDRRGTVLAPKDVSAHGVASIAVGQRRQLIRTQVLHICELILPDLELPWLRQLRSRNLAHKTLWRPHQT